jgi:putative toxin-antitoxin system antitoxin component (TIGR02293 family)
VGINLYREILGEEEKPISSSHLQEPAAEYLRSSPGSGDPTLMNFKLTRAGLKKKSLMKLKAETKFTLEEIAGYLHITPRTIQRYTDDQVLSQPVSERLVSILEVYNRGYEVFEDPAIFHEWIATPSAIFNNEAPKTYLDNHYGIELILDELGRIEHGLFA